MPGRGSDLHLKVGSPPRMRVDGRLVVLDGPNLTPDMAEELLRDLIRPDLHQQFQRTNEADPIEVLHADKLGMVNQREVRVDTDDFTIAMRAAMRQDPDVILVGEIRDAETLRTSLAAAETGHLVLSTLHTADAAETVNRCIDLFPPYQQRQVRLSLATALRGIVGQRLVRRAGDGGRVAVLEVMVNTGRIAEAIALGVASNPHDLQVALRNQGLVA